MYITESLCCTAEINTTLQLYYNKILKKKKKREAKLAELGKVERDTNLYFAASKMPVGPSFGSVEPYRKSAPNTWRGWGSALPSVGSRGPTQQPPRERRGRSLDPTRKEVSVRGDLPE